MDYDNITDQELKEALTQHGVNVGGISATSRKLYVNKLKKLDGITGGGAVLINGSGDGNSYNHDESHEEQPVILNDIYPSLEATPRQRAVKKSPSPFAHDEDSDYGEESSRIIPDDEMMLLREESVLRRSPLRTNGSNLVYTVLKLVLFTAALVFLYFMFENASKAGNRETI